MKKQVVLFLSAMCIFCMVFSTMVLANENVAEVGGVGYPTLSDAYNAVVKGSGDTITLLKSSAGEGLVIDTDVTIDFDGYTYYINEPVGSTNTVSNGFQILKENEVVLKNGRLEIYASSASDFYILIQNYADLTIENMELDGTYLDKYSTTDGDSYVLSNNCGTINITGETNITANDEGDLAFAFDVCKYKTYDAPTVNVSTTGLISGDIEVTEVAPAEGQTAGEGTPTLTISSGTYTMPIEAGWCANGFEPKDNGDGTYGVIEAGFIVKVDGTGYVTITEAYNAVAEGETITFITDASGEGLVINKDVTIDFGGYTYSFTEPAVGSNGTETNGFQILKGHKVTLKNGTLNVDKDYAELYYILIQNYANLTLENMTLDGTYLDKYSTTDGDSYVLSNNCGTINITGETNITANDEGDLAFAFDVCKYKTYDAPTVNVSTTGLISGDIEVTEVAPAEGQTVGEGTPTLTISSGTYTLEIPEDWCAEGYNSTKNSDDTWSVIKKIYFITFNWQNNAGTVTEEVIYGDVVKFPEVPTIENYSFGGWYTDLDCTNVWDVTATIIEDITLYAKWTVTSSSITAIPSGGGSSTPKYDINTENTGDVIDVSKLSGAKKGQKVEIKVNENEIKYNEKIVILDEEGNEVEYTIEEGKLVFTMLESDIEIKIVEEEVKSSFDDVKKGEYYHDSVAWAEKKGITKGTGNGKFSPEKICTRAEIITSLWRAAGSPIVEGDRKVFDDVSNDAYYYDAVAWAEANGITTGTSITTFDPDAECSRAEMVTFLWRSQNRPVEEKTTDFDDVENNAFYAEAVNWAANNEITKGTQENRFSAEEKCNRGQMVTFLFRLFANY